MKAVTLLYHDAITDNRWEESGFPGEDSAVYKLDSRDMALHFDEIARNHTNKPSSIHEKLDGRDQTAIPFFLTFDDGGVSAYTHIAELLSFKGWIGHFFITADHIDTPSFLNKNQIRELRKMGHVIGSHSMTHPARMSACNWEDLVTEWSNSISILSDIVGEKVDVASVPGGYFSRDVAKAASTSGIRALFTSEPVKKAYLVDGCLVLGRYTLLRGKPPMLSAGLSSETISRAQIKQYLLWQTKKIFKALGGKYYIRFRKSYLEDRSRTNNRS